MYQTKPTTTLNNNASSSSYILDLWSKKIKTASGRTDATAVYLLSEIYYLHQPSKFGHEKKFDGDLLRLRYKDLEEKFQKSRETIRKGFCTLEKLGLINRIIGHYHGNSIKDRSVYCANVLYIKFNREKFESLFNTPKLTNFSNQKSNLCLISKNVQTDTTNNLLVVVSGTSEKNDCSFDHTQIQTFQYPPKNWGTSTQKLGDVYKEKKESKEANSYGLSFFSFSIKMKINSVQALPYYFNNNQEIQNNKIGDISDIPEFTQLLQSISASEKILSDQTLILLQKTKEFANKKEILQKDPEQESDKQRLKHSNLRNFDDYKRKFPSEFLPIDPELCNLVRSATGKNFPDVYFEQAIHKFISQDQSKSKSGFRSKWSKVYLLSRLVGWANRELKNLSTILEEFGPKSSEEIEIVKSEERDKKLEEKEDERIISQYENIRDTSLYGLLKKKIAGSCDRDIAAFLLRCSDFSIYPDRKQVIAKISIWNEKTESMLYSSDDGRGDGQLDVKSPKLDKSKKLELERILSTITTEILGHGSRAEIICDFWKNMSANTIEYNNAISYSSNEIYKNVQKSLHKRFGEGAYKSWFSKLEFYRVKDSITISSPEDMAMILGGMQLSESRRHRIYGESIYVV